MRAHFPARTAACVGLILAACFHGSVADAAIGQFKTMDAGATLPVTKAAFYCSPGFELNYAEQCVATASRAQVELFVDQPIYGADETVVRHYRHRHHRNGIRERY